jgi:catechol 2,3-dioxygenase-like lactoylglutathione lyase family enzyme
LADTRSGLPPALVITGGTDPLRDDSRAYADKFRAAGVPTRHVEYERAIHAFLNFPGALPDAWRAIDEISEFLRTRLQRRPETSPHLQHVTLLYERERAADLRAFYSGTLGLREKPAPEAFARAGIIWFEAGDGQPELHFVPADDAGAAIPHFCVDVSDLGATALRVEQAGIQIEHGDAIPNRPRFFVQDPFRNEVEIASIGGMNGRS